MTDYLNSLPIGKAETIKKTFSRRTSVRQSIQADPSIIWALLTNAPDFSRWNSTVISIEGEIQKGQNIKLKSSLAPNRTFHIKIKEMIPEQKMIWGDAMGQRDFILEKKGNATIFTMTEIIGGLIFPLFASQLPPFDEAFEQYAQDLKKEAEAIGQSK
ncbi:MAG: SRPBCC domain-containing protein [Bacteroidota bacterium]